MARNVILNLAVSLDGRIEGPNGEYDWCFTDQDYGMTAFFKRIDAIFLGRKSCEVLLREDLRPYPHLTKYLFSTTMESAPDGFRLIRGDIATHVASIKEEPGKDIWLFGGASLVTSFVREGLLDELMVSVHPVLLGAGTPLLGTLQQRLPLTLTATKTYSTGLVQLTYLIRKNTLA